MEFFNQAIDILKILVMALGAGLAVWGVINLLEGYGSVSYTHLDVYKRQDVDMELAAHYCRLAYEAGFSPICPLLYLSLIHI